MENTFELHQRITKVSAFDLDDGLNAIVQYELHEQLNTVEILNIMRLSADTGGLYFKVKPKKTISFNVWIKAFNARSDIQLYSLTNLKINYFRDCTVPSVDYSDCLILYNSALVDKTCLNCIIIPNQYNIDTSLLNISIPSMVHEEFPDVSINDDCQNNVRVQRMSKNLVHLRYFSNKIISHNLSCQLEFTRGANILTRLQFSLIYQTTTNFNLHRHIHEIERVANRLCIRNILAMFDISNPKLLVKSNNSIAPFSCYLQKCCAIYNRSNSVFDLLYFVLVDSKTGYIFDLFPFSLFNIQHRRRTKIYPIQTGLCMNSKYLQQIEREKAQNRVLSESETCGEYPQWINIYDGHQTKNALCLFNGSNSRMLTYTTNSHLHSNGSAFILDHATKDYSASRECSVTIDPENNIIKGYVILFKGNHENGRPSTWLMAKIAIVLVVLKILTYQFIVRFCYSSY
ncbi:hypothetical protein ACOME3_009269 [Neoechinorhynchus agilis]